MNFSNFLLRFKPRLKKGKEKNIAINNKTHNLLIYYFFINQKYRHFLLDAKEG